MKSNEKNFSQCSLLCRWRSHCYSQRNPLNKLHACGYSEMESMPSIRIIYGNTFKTKVILAEAKTTIRLSCVKGTCSQNTAKTCYANIYTTDLQAVRTSTRFTRTQSKRAQQLDSSSCSKNANTCRRVMSIDCAPLLPNMWNFRMKLEKSFFISF